VSQDHASTWSAPTSNPTALEESERAPGSDARSTHRTQSPQPVTASPQPKAVAARHRPQSARSNVEPTPAPASPEERKLENRDPRREETARPEVDRKSGEGSRVAVTPIVVLPQAHPAASGQPAPAQQPPAQEEDEIEEPGTQSGTDLDSDDGDRGRSVDAEPDNARIVVVGPAGVRARDFVTFTLAAENVKGLSHAPIRLAYDAAVLEFVSAEEGGFLASDGATTQFMVKPGETPGTLDIALSRMASAGGIDGSGVLATVTFLARGQGMSPIVTAGSRFLDAAARGMNLRSDDAYVSVQ